MILQVFLFLFIHPSVWSTPWSRQHGCPLSCSCREEHFSDLAIARYTRPINHPAETLATDYYISNDVVYNDDEMKYDDENPLLRVATCSIQAETNIEQFVLTIPKDIQVLSFIKSSNSGIKTLQMSHLNYFDELVALEVQGSDSVVLDSSHNDFVIEIDSAIMSLSYINLDQIKLKNTKLRNRKIPTDDNDDDDDDDDDDGEEQEEEEDIEIKFESVTVIQKKKKEQDSEILPYYKYKEIQKNLENPVLSEFSSLILARIHSCNLQNIHWEMFDGLQNLKYLYLEKNHLKFIPNFAFYGTPNLAFLSLAWNNLLNIQITDLAGLLELEYLDLSHNNFSQLSELSFPPFPKLKVADFRDNPITTVFPNTFDIMNTTDSIIIGSEQIPLQLLPNSFLGLNQLIKLSIYNIDVAILTQDMLTGMPILKQLILTGKINEVEFDAFIQVKKLEKLILSNCSIYNISMDAFYGLNNLLVLDLSKNRLNYLPPNIFDEQTKLKELLLNGNEFVELPKGIFYKIPAKLVRLNDNPWHCSCAMGDWDPMIINKIKQKIVTVCDARHDKGLGCAGNENKYAYAYENRMAPKCNSPKTLKDLSVFQAIRRYLHCKAHKLKLKSAKSLNEQPIQKHHKNSIQNNQLSNLNNYKMKDNIESNNLFGSIKLENRMPEVHNNQPDFGFYFHDGIDRKNEKVDKLLYKKKKHMLTLAKIRKVKTEDNYNLHKEM